MAKIPFLSKLLTMNKTPFRLKVRKVAQGTALAAAATLGGAVAGGGTAPAGLRKAGAKEGALRGVGVAALGAGTFVASKVIFRRIRGRIIPIRVK